MDLYKYNLNTYKYPPTDYCTMQELEKIGVERLQLYKIMNDATNLDRKPNSRKWEEYVQSKIIQNRLKTYVVLLKNEETSVGLIKARMNNHIGHWLLSLCYCRKKDWKYFFMCCELSLFLMLYKRTKNEDLIGFLSENEFNYLQVTPDEKILFKDRLISSRNLKETFDDTDFYKAKFTEVTNLVRLKQVFLYRGFAYIPYSDVVFCVKNKLWRQFNRQLTWTNRMIPTAIKEDRIQDFLTSVPVFVPTTRYISDTPIKIDIDNIDEIAEKHFPLCMTAIHAILRTEHHLKYNCKMQYGIFLKCLGMEYEDAMTFWKEEFTKKMSPDWFDRKYSYLFKHQYGKVGGMLDYQPYSCDRIQAMCLGPREQHGCPFKHWDVDKVLDKCQSEGITRREAQDIEGLVSKGKYKEACTTYFCGRHKVVRSEVIESPNQYFKESYEMEKALDGYFDALFDSLETEDYL